VLFGVQPLKQSHLLGIVTSFGEYCDITSFSFCSLHHDDETALGASLHSPQTVLWQMP
jgi:hypothetical protein